MTGESADLHDRLVALVEPELRLHDVELVDLELLPGGRRLTLRFSVEKRCPPGVDSHQAPRITLDECAEMSRVVGRVLEAADQGEDEFLPRRYVVEVSSPGVFRRLSRLEHFRRYVGEMVRATIVDSEDPERSHQLRGRLGQADEGGIELIAEDGTAHRIALAHVRRAHLDPDLDFRGEGGRARRGGGSNDGEAGRA